MKQRVVLDTNVLVSAALRPQSTPRHALNLAIARDQLAMSADALDELIRVLQLPKFDRYAPPADRMELPGLLRRHASIFQVTPEHLALAAGACRDADDEVFLALAIAANASVIVSGDADLLTMDPWRGIAICTAAAYVAQR